MWLNEGMKWNAQAKMTHHLTNMYGCVPVTSHWSTCGYKYKCICLHKKNSYLRGWVILVIFKLYSSPWKEEFCKEIYYKNAI